MSSRSFVVASTIVAVGIAGSLTSRSAEASCDYTVTVPGPADIWNTGSLYNIQWFKSGTCADRVDLHLMRDDEAVWTIATNEPNNGTASWVVPNSMPTALEYRIRVRDRDDSSSVGMSTEFTILNSASCGYRVTQPAEGEVWYASSQHTIRWSRAGNCPSPVTLHLMFKGGQVMEIANGIADIGSFTWEVPDFLSEGEDYSVRIRDANDRNAYDTSEKFSIRDEPTCDYDVTEPDATTVWRIGETRDIRWSHSSECGSRVDLHLLRDGVEVEEIADSIDDTGVASWSVPAGLETGAGYVVRVRSADDDALYGVSEQFEILEAAAPERYVYWLEIAAREDGLGGSVWRTDVVLKNLAEDDAAVEIRLDGTDDVTLSTLVPGSSQAVFEDVLGVMGVDGKGWLEVVSDQQMVVLGRIYNQSDGGTFGQYLDGVSAQEGLQSGDLGYLVQLRQQSGQYRTNLTLTNPTSEAASLRVTLFDSAGEEMLRYRIDLGPMEVYQDLEPYSRRASRPDLGWGFASIEVLEGTSALVSASVIDSRTNDATTVPVRFGPR
jgi:hypothetical protein